MGNCQAVDAAALVIQHPNGQLERMYWPLPASEVMKMNPGHYVSLIIPLRVDGEGNSDGKTVRFTRVKLLRPTDTLVLGRAYRLVTTQEVMKVLRAKKYAKMMKNRPEAAQHIPVEAEMQNDSCHSETGRPAAEKNDELIRHDSHRQRSGTANGISSRSKSWRPSLQSIAESGS